ncbi:Pentatricopeptide repeat-containing protein [Apostasia shenzhenica]|uniref:Pentatricopeptide repeat-containing protein n=1 Tax=Apostasia shenzhenica TaxID=1088818 RepID=A0A2H9ZWX7_9ASPA|nr:Pentatricopeptide repeat-containing protein [Apostasia shenzhenica]
MAAWTKAGESFRLIIAKDERICPSHFSLCLQCLILLHSSSWSEETIPKILRQMKADWRLAHVSPYNILLKIEADEHNIEGFEVFNEMKKMEVNQVRLHMEF